MPSAANLTPPLDRAIAAAEAALPEFRRLNDIHNEAEKAVYAANGRLADEKKAATVIADQAAPRPELLKFRRDDDRRVVGMGFRFASGRESWTEFHEDEVYLPESRNDLIRHCTDKGLEPDAYVKAWDQWKAAHEEAFFKAMPKEWRDAQVAEAEAGAAWRKSLRQVEHLAARVLKAKVRTPEELVRKLQAYADICEAFGMDVDELVDSEGVFALVLKNLSGLPKEPAGKANLRLVA